MDSKEHAQNLLNYFQETANLDPNPKWKLGAEVARTWLELINAPLASQEDIDALVEIISQYKSQSSGWFDLGIGVRHWARSKGYSIPPLWPSNAEATNQDKPTE
jgi:hypothetical protein